MKSKSIISIAVLGTAGYLIAKKLSGGFGSGNNGDGSFGGTDDDMEDLNGIGVLGQQPVYYPRIYEQYQENADNPTLQNNTKNNQDYSNEYEYDNRQSNKNIFGGDTSNWYNSSPKKVIDQKSNPYSPTNLSLGVIGGIPSIFTGFGTTMAKRTFKIGEDVEGSIFKQSMKESYNDLPLFSQKIKNFMFKNSDEVGEKLLKVGSEEVAEKGLKVALKQGVKTGSKSFLSLIPFVGTIAGAMYDTRTDNRNFWTESLPANIIGDVAGAVGGIGAGVLTLNPIAVFGADVGGQIVGTEGSYKAIDYIKHKYHSALGMKERESPVVQNVKPKTNNVQAVYKKDFQQVSGNFFGGDTTHKVSTSQAVQTSKSGHKHKVNPSRVIKHRTTGKHESLSRNRHQRRRDRRARKKAHRRARKH